MFETFWISVFTSSKRFGFVSLRVRNVSVSCFHVFETFRFRVATRAKRFGFVSLRVRNVAVPCRYVRETFRIFFAMCAKRFGFVTLRVLNVSVSCCYVCDKFWFRVSRTLQAGQRNPFTAVFTRKAFHSGFIQLNRVLLALAQSIWAHQFGEPGLFCATKLMDMYSKDNVFSRIQKIRQSSRIVRKYDRGRPLPSEEGTPKKGSGTFT